MSKEYHSSSGIGFCGALALLFIALKLIGVIGWSWWWVLSPILIPISIILTIILILLIIVFIGELIK